MDKFEDDYDSGFYNSIDNSNFNYEIVEEDDKNTTNTTKINPSSIPKFIKSKHYLQSTISIDFKTPELPSDYDPFKNPFQSSSGIDLNAYERNEGFKNKVDPKIISHPANCRLMVHSENISKNKKSDITIEELLIKIDNWDKKYLVD